MEQGVGGGLTLTARAASCAAAVVTILAALAGPAPAVAGAGPSDPLSKPATFADPPMSVRPKFRWWWATPYDPNEATAELDAMARAGFGGVEAAFNTDGWATPEQRRMLAASLQAAKANDMRLDMTLGASWPVTTPSTKPGSGLSEQELTYGRRDLAGPATYTGPAPNALDDPTGRQRGGKLVAVTAARVISEGPPATPGPSVPLTPSAAPASSTVLDPSSLVDLTSKVDAAGNVTWDVPAGRWILFGLWQRDASEGVMDHLSPDSLNAAAADIDRSQLGDEASPLLPAAGGQFFEDSLELDADQLWWTGRFFAEFRKRRGYDIAKYLPLVFIEGEDHYWVPDKQPTPDFATPDATAERVRHDYYETLTDLYIDYHLKGWVQWARTHGMQYRSQVAYGDAFDVTRSARAVDEMGGIADEESLNAGDNPPVKLDGPNWRFAFDHYRSLVGGAHQAGQDVVQDELGAVFVYDHMMNLSDYKAIMDKQWAAGVTRPIIHGYAFQPAGSPWPGHDNFFGLVADSWNHRTFPQWSMLRPLTDYWARGAQVLENGRPREDVAVYRDGFVTTAATASAIGTNAGVYQLDPESPTPILTSPAGDQAVGTAAMRPTPFFDGRALERAGYTYEFLDPQGLADPDAAGDGVLYPAGPAYRAIVVDERALPGATAEALARAAQRGLAVVFVGSLPDRGTSNAAPTSEDAQVRDAVRRTMTTGRARHVAAQGDVLGALRDLGVEPAARWSAPVPVYSQHRQVRERDYWYLWNSGDAPVSFTGSFAATGAPSVLDLWTGEIRPAGAWRARGARIDVPVTLGPGETTVLGFGGTETTEHVESVDGGSVVGGDGTAEVRDTSGGTRSVQLSDGSTRRVALPELPKPLVPAAWHLHVDEVTPSGTTPHDLDLTALQDWRDISEISRASGTGTYTTKFDLPGGWTGDDRGTYLDLGRAEGGVQVYVNGRPPAPDVVPDRRFDVGGLLHASTNELRVVLTTTLKNEIVKQQEAGTVNSSGAFAAQPATQPYGLLGPVRLVPYGRATVELPRVRSLSGGRACTSRRRFTVHVRAPRGFRTRSATLRVNGSVRRAKVTRRGRRLAVVVDLRGTPRRRAVVRLTVRGRGHRVLRTARSYWPCAKKRGSR